LNNVDDFIFDPLSSDYLVTMFRPIMKKPYMSGV
jgi:hypothetical protein